MVEVSRSDVLTNEKSVGIASGFSFFLDLTSGISSLFKSRSKQSSVKCSEHTRLVSLVFQTKLGEPLLQKGFVSQRQSEKADASLVVLAVVARTESHTVRHGFG